MESLWLIWSNEHHAYWAPERCGYTKSANAAGRYQFSEAIEICRDARIATNDDAPPPETMLREDCIAR